MNVIYTWPSSDISTLSFTQPAGQNPPSVLAAQRGWATAGGIRAEPADFIHALIAAPGPSEAEAPKVGGDLQHSDCNDC